MELSIVILNYNTKELTLECLNSIAQQYQKELDNGVFEIVLVDNASSDGSLEFFKKLKTKGLSLIDAKENLGFSKGCNLGARNSKGEFILFLNSDTTIKDQGFLKMVEYFKKNEDVGILGGKLKNADGTNQLSGGKFYNLFNLFQILLGFERVGLIREVPIDVKKIDWVSGACLMIRRKIFEKLNGFESRLFMYMEDMEFCFRAAKRGFPTYFYPEIILFHKETGSSNRTFAILNIYKGILFFYRKHKPFWQYQIARLMLFSKAFVLNTFGKITKNKYYIETYGQALELF